MMPILTKEYMCFQSGCSRELPVPSRSKRHGKDTCSEKITIKTLKGILRGKEQP